MDQSEARKTGNTGAIARIGPGSPGGHYGCVSRLRGEGSNVDLTFFHLPDATRTSTSCGATTTLLKAKFSVLNGTVVGFFNGKTTKLSITFLHHTAVPLFKLAFCNSRAIAFAPTRRISAPVFFHTLGFPS